MPNINDILSQTMDKAVAQEANAKPYIPTGKYSVVIDNVMLKDYPKNRPGAGYSYFELTNSIYEPETGSKVGIITNGVTWVSIRLDSGKLIRDTVLMGQLMTCLEVEDLSIEKAYNKLLDKPKLSAYIAESCRCNVNDLPSELQEQYIASGRAIHDQVYVSIAANPDGDWLREHLTSKGRVSYSNILTYYKKEEDDIPF